MNFQDHFTDEMRQAFPHITDIKDAILKGNACRIKCLNLANMKLPATNEAGLPVLVGNLNKMQQLANYYFYIMGERLSLLRTMVEDSEYYEFVDNLPGWSGAARNH